MYLHAKNYIQDAVGKAFNKQYEEGLRIGDENRQHKGDEPRRTSEKSTHYGKSEGRAATVHNEWIAKSNQDPPFWISQNENRWGCRTGAWKGPAAISNKEAWITEQRDEAIKHWFRLKMVNVKETGMDIYPLYHNMAGPDCRVALVGSANQRRDDGDLKDLHAFDWDGGIR